MLFSCIFLALAPGGWLISGGLWTANLPAIRVLYQLAVRYPVVSGFYEWEPENRPRPWPKNHTDDSNVGWELLYIATFLKTCSLICLAFETS